MSETTLPEDGSAVRILTECSRRRDMMCGAGYGPGGVSSEFRYTLFREWDLPTADLFSVEPVSSGPAPFVLWVLCNPSTATHWSDDPTVAKVCRLTRRWGFRRVEVRNIFPYRATYPVDLRSYHLRGRGDARGDNELNNRVIREALADPLCALCVAAWGNNGQFLRRSEEVREILAASSKRVFAFRISNVGEPEHPLYQRECISPDQGMVRLGLSS